MGDAWAWLLFFFILIAILVMVITQEMEVEKAYRSRVRVVKTTTDACIKLISLADLEFDYINPYDSASRINSVVLPEFITQGVLCFLYLITGHWVMSLLCVPYLYYNVKLYMQRRHLVDVTEIFNMLNWEKKQRLFKLGYIVFLILISLFWLIYSALEDHDEF